MTKTYLMARGRILRIQDGAGSVVHVHSGALWLTQEGDGRDYYLGEGSALRLSGSGLGERSSFGMRLLRFWCSLYAPHARPTTVSL